jgi:hypothetical protein
MQIVYMHNNRMEYYQTTMVHMSCGACTRVNLNARCVLVSATNYSYEWRQLHY